jgi:hypothetical protein
MSGNCGLKVGDEVAEVEGMNNETKSSKRMNWNEADTARLLTNWQSS